VGEELADVTDNSACASNMMSDVLAFVKEQAVLITDWGIPKSCAQLK